MTQISVVSLPWMGIAGAIGSAILAGFGAWIGARLAFRRFKSERAFDRRLTWYEDTCRALHRVRTHFETGAALDNAGFIAMAQDQYLKAFSLGDAIAAANLQAEMYAGQASLDALNRLMVSANEFSEQMHPIPKDSPDPAMVANRVMTALQHAAALGSATKVLADEIRSQLGLGRIARPAWRPLTQRGIRQLEERLRDNPSNFIVSE